MKSLKIIMLLMGLLCWLHPLCAEETAGSQSDDIDVGEILFGHVGDYYGWHITEWNGKPIQMELHHIDGNRTNHKLSNLMMLCPNCHKLVHLKGDIEEVKKIINKNKNISKFRF